MSWAATIAELIYVYLAVFLHWEWECCLREQVYDTHGSHGIGARDNHCGSRSFFLRDLQQGRPSNSSEKLSELPSARTDCPHVPAHLQRRAPVGQGDQSCRNP